MKEQHITCIICPIGCDIVVRGQGEVISSMEGHQCKRGVEYARSEFVHPVRILTTTVRVEGADQPLLPIRSDRPLPKEKLMDCMERIKEVSVKRPVARYQVIVPDILGTGVNMVATGEAP